MQIPFIGDSGQGRSLNVNASRSINFFVEAVSQDSKSPLTLVGTFGCSAAIEFPYGPIRMTHTVVGRCFVVAADTLYEIYTDNTFMVRGTFLTSIGRMAVANNGLAANGVGGDQIIIIDSTAGYIFNLASNTLTQITDSNFPTNAQHVAYLDGYFIVTDDTMGFHVSELYDGFTWPGLAFAAATGTPDNIQRPFSLHQQLYLVKEFSTEIWQNVGTPTTQGSPFQRVAGAILDYGTPAPWSVVRGNNTMFFLANARNADSGEFAGVVAMNGYSPQMISTPAINYRISRFSTISDAWGFCYADEGHIFYQLTFPTEDTTFVYDATTNMWHERSTHINGTSPYSVHRHLADTYTFFGGKHLVGDYQSGKLMEMSSAYYDDDGTSIISIRMTQPIYDRNELDNVKISKLIVDCEGGVGDGTVEPADPFGGLLLMDNTYIPLDGTIRFGGADYVLTHNGNPQAYLSWSNDGGHTWSAEYGASIGRMGEYNRRLIWRRLGAPRNRVFRLRMVDSVKKVLLGAYINDGASS